MMVTRQYLLLPAALLGTAAFLSGCPLPFGIKRVPGKDPLAGSFVKVVQVSGKSFKLADGRTYELAGVDISALNQTQRQAFEQALAKEVIGRERLLVLPASPGARDGPAEIKRSVPVVLRQPMCGLRPIVLIPIPVEVPPTRRSIAALLIGKGLAPAALDAPGELVSRDRDARWGHRGIWRTDRDRLDEAIEKDDRAAVTALLDKGAEINAPGHGHGGTALHWAVRHGRIAIAKTLLARGAKVNEPDLHGTSALYWAAEGDQLAAAKTLLAHGARVNTAERGSLRDSPLHVAARKGQLEFVCLLLAHGADVNATNGLRQTPLMLASAEGHLECLRLLLDHGADANARSAGWNQGWAALHGAAYRGHCDVARLLVRRGAAVNITNTAGKTPLDVIHDTMAFHRKQPRAACREHTAGLQAVRRLLLEHGAKSKGPRR